MHEFHAAIIQASILYKRYTDYLTDEQKKMLLEFINLEKKRSIDKKITILKYRFFKQDLFRTIGFLGLV